MKKMGLPFEEFFSKKHYSLVKIYFFHVDLRDHFINHMKNQLKIKKYKDPLRIGKEFSSRHELFFLKIYKNSKNENICHLIAEEAILDFYPNFNVDLDDSKRNFLVSDVVCWALCMIEENE
jgi:hypothetical protein